MNIAKAHITPWIEYAAIRGVAIADLKTRFPFIEHEEGKETLATIAMTDFYSVIQYITSQINDDLIGIKSGQFLSLKLLGLIYQISLQAHTIKEALYYLTNYTNTSFPALHFETNDTETEVHITISLAEGDPETNRIVLEHIITIIGREIEIMVAESSELRMCSPYYDARYPAQWSKGTGHSISFQKVILKAAIRERKDQQLDVLIPQYLQLMETYKKAGSFSDKVKLTILSLSDPVLPDISKVAETLYLTPRTMQRKLALEQNSYRQLLQGVKKEIAASLLRHEGYSVTNMAYVLGYADAASFIHSFKKWFGVPPERMRVSL